MPAPRAQGGRQRLGDFVSGFENDLLKDIIPYVESHIPCRQTASTGRSPGCRWAGVRTDDRPEAPGHFATRRLLFCALRQYGRARLSSSRREQEASPPLAILRRRGSAHGRQQDLPPSLEKKNVTHLWHVDSGGHTGRSGRTTCIYFPRGCSETTSPTHRAGCSPILALVGPAGVAKATWLRPPSRSTQPLDSLSAILRSRHSAFYSNRPEGIDPTRRRKRGDD